MNRLQTDYFDFYLLHSMDENFISAYMDEEKNYLGYLLEQKKLLSEQEQEILKKAADAFFEEMGVPCSGCRYCCPVCPAGLDIPLLITIHA